jgi:hypothetical protein
LRLVVRPTWNHVEAVDGEELFGHVVPAHGVLEGEVELVLGLGLPVALEPVLFRALELATYSIQIFKNPTCD